jgi:predicted nucleotidyltransferase
MKPLDTELRSFNQFISEKIEYHQELCPQIWKGQALHEEIHKKLMAIANDFTASLKLTVPVIDVQLTGSLANYNWTKKSDLDVHIIIDFSQVDTNVALVRTAMDGQRFLWNERHNVAIEGHEVECYVQDVRAQHTSSGLFSLLSNKWIILPVNNPPQVDEKDVREKTRVFKSELKEIKSKLKTSTGEKAIALFDYTKRLKNKLMSDRQEGLTRDGEFSVENLVFKKLRNDGTLEQLIHSMSKAYANIYAD